MIDHRRIKRFTGQALIGAMAALLPAAASASVIFTNFGPSLTYDTTQGGVVGNDFAGDNSAQGDSFMVSSNARFRIGAGGAELCCGVLPLPENFSVALTADSGDSPGSYNREFCLHRQNPWRVGKQ